MISATGFVLAGGFSRRFGTNKALFLLRQRPLIQYSLDTLSACFSHVSVISKDVEPYSQFGVPVLRDESDLQTPLAGILTGLRNTHTEWNFFLACDMPMMSQKIIRRLYRRAKQPGQKQKVEVVLPVAGGKWQPLAAFYRKNLLETLPGAIEKQISVRDWIKLHFYGAVRFEQTAEFTNINTREELDALETD